MKNICLLLILISFQGCQIKSNANEDLKYYNNGIDIIGQPDNNGVIDYSKALMMFKHSVEVNPNHIESYYWKMFCELHLNQFEESLKTSHVIINNTKNSKHILYVPSLITAGMIEKEIGDSTKTNKYLTEALSIYNQSIKKNKNDIDAIANKAIVLCYMNKKEDALRFLDSISLTDENERMLVEFREQLINFDGDNILEEIIKTTN